ncbi:MAG: hypothetical protein KBG28_11910 [Kofleriaceae bacterium]|nr:hypothetical protein [Kofleriaceae bacterium]
MRPDSEQGGLVAPPEPLRSQTRPPPFSSLAARVDARLALTADGAAGVAVDEDVDEVEFDRPVAVEVARARAGDTVPPLRQVVEAPAPAAPPPPPPAPVPAAPVEVAGATTAADSGRRLVVAIPPLAPSASVPAPLPREESGEVEELSELDDMQLEADVPAAPRPVARPPVRPPLRPPLPPLRIPPAPPVGRPVVAVPPLPRAKTSSRPPLPPPGPTTPASPPSPTPAGPLASASAEPPGADDAAAAVTAALASSHLLDVAERGRDADEDDAPASSLMAMPVAMSMSPRLHTAPIALVADEAAPVAAAAAVTSTVEVEVDDLEPVGASPGAGGDDLAVATQTPTVVVDTPLETQLETPTVLDRALADTGDAALERRAQEVAAELEAATGPAAAALAYELGELYERRLADEARAVKAFGRALAADPSYRPNLWAIRRIFYRRALWPNLLKLIDAELRLCKDDGERAELWVERGRVVGQRLEQRAEARQAFEEAVKANPGHQGALLELERIGQLDRDLGLLREVWARLAECAGDPVRRCLYLLDLARAHADAGEFAPAQDAVARASALGVERDRVVAEQIRLAELGDAPDALRAALDARAASLEARFGEAGVGVAVLARDPGQPPDPSTRVRLELVAVRRRQAQVARASGQADEAWGYLQRALAVAPGEPILLADLIELAEELGRYDELAELVESWQSIEADPGRGLALSLRRVDALLRGGQRDAARPLLASLEASHRGFVALTALAERDAIQQGDPADLARVYLAAADSHKLGTVLGPSASGADLAPDPDAAVASYVAAAELWAHHVGGDVGRAEAEAALQQALELRPDDAAALAALLDITLASGRLDDAAGLLAARVERGQPPEQRAALERLGHLRRSRGDVDGAIDADRRLVAVAGDPDGRIGWRIEGLLAQAGRDEERAQHLVALSESDPSPERRLIAAASAARLLERIGQVDKAIGLYRLVLGRDPDDAFARASLVDLLRADERWAELVEERQREAAALPDGAAAGRAQREAAWVLEVRLGQPAAAAAAWRAMLDRAPDDATALDGLVRTLGADPAASVEFLERIADAAAPEHAAAARLELALALERAGRRDDAVDAYRALVTAGDGGLPAQAAALALVELAVASGDSAMRLEMTQQLAAWGQAPDLIGSLLEDAAWFAALTLEDPDRAGELFAQALAIDASRPGCQLGAALVAARRGDPTAMAHAYGALAVSAGLPAAATALHLRAAALAAAAGDGAGVVTQVAAARAASDDVGAVVVAADLASVVAQPDPRDPSAYVDAQLARAEVLAMRADLADEAGRASWDLERAETLEAAGRLREAGQVVAAVLRADGDDLRALEALRRLARKGGDTRTAARAAYRLACLLGDAGHRLALLREAAAVFDAAAAPRAGARPATASGAGADVTAAMATYRRLLATDPGAAEFNRYAELLRQASDVGGLHGALSDRLTWLGAEGGPAGPAAVPILLERATLAFGIGDHAGAIADLDDLLGRDARNGEALRFRADLAHKLGDTTTALALWRRYVEVEPRAERRAEVELTLTRVLSEDTGDLAGAVEQLAKVVEHSPDDLALHERMVGLATRAGDFTRVASSLREMGRLRGSGPERARDELRLAAVLRDKVRDKAAARLALDRGRKADPLNLEVIRELADLLEAGPRAQLLASAADEMRLAIAAGPGKVGLYDRLSTIAAWQSDVEARWLAVAGVEALGTPSAEQRAVLAAGRAHVPAIKRVALAPAQRALIGAAGPGQDGARLGATGELWRALAPAVTAALALEPGKLGFVRADRVAFKKLGEKFGLAAALAGQLGLGDLDVYVSEGRAGVARALAADTPTLCLGADVARADHGPARFALARALVLAAEATGPLLELKDVELLWMWAAALQVAGVPVPPILAEAAAADRNPVDERVRLLDKHWGRRDKKAFAALPAARAIDAADLTAFRRHAAGVGNRFGLLAVGDLAIALAYLDVGRGGRAVVDSPLALELTAWSVGAAHLALRHELGYELGADRGGGA